MKCRIRIPTVEYGFLEEDFDGSDFEMSQRVQELIGICRGGVGLSEKEWREALDKYMSLKGIGAMDSDTYYKMNDAQQRMIQELKKHYKRLT